MHSASPLVRKKVGGERGVEGCVPLTGELREEHTPLTSPLPKRRPSHRGDCSSWDPRTVEF